MIVRGPWKASSFSFCFFCFCGDDTLPSLAGLTGSLGTMAVGLGIFMCFLSVVGHICGMYSLKSYLR